MVANIWWSEKKISYSCIVLSATYLSLIHLVLQKGRNIYIYKKGRNIYINRRYIYINICVWVCVCVCVCVYIYIGGFLGWVMFTVRNFIKMLRIHSIHLMGCWESNPMQPCFLCGQVVYLHVIQSTWWKCRM